MPTVLRIESFRFVVYPNDHVPPHVHVFDSDGTARIALGGEDERPCLMDHIDIGPAKLRRALEIVLQHQEVLLMQWRKIHG